MLTHLMETLCSEQGGGAWPTLMGQVSIITVLGTAFQRRLTNWTLFQVA